MSGDVIFDIAVIFVQEGARALSAVGNIPPSFVFGVSMGVAGYRLVRIHINNRKFKDQTARNNRQDYRFIRIERLLNLIETPMPEFIKSPNYLKGRLFKKISFIVVHSMAGNIEPSIALFKKPERNSAHYLIGHDGRVVQMVDEANTAYHAGNWRVNLSSIGIEHQGGEFPDGHNEHLQDPGYEASALLIADIHRGRGWGEPSSATVRPHNAFVATKCPSGLDVSKLIQMAQDAYNGRVVIDVPRILINVPIETPEAPQPVAAYEPFNTNLEPSQVYRAEVKRVQQFLVDKKFMAVPGLNEWGFYGKKTQRAIDSFQKRNGIKASASYFGWWYPQTRNKANQQLTK